MIKKIHNEEFRRWVTIAELNSSFKMIHYASYAESRMKYMTLLYLYFMRAIGLIKKLKIKECQAASFYADGEVKETPGILRIYYLPRKRFNELMQFHLARGRGELINDIPTIAANITTFNMRDLRVWGRRK